MVKISKTPNLYEYHEVRWYQQANSHILTGYLRDQTTEECLWNFSRISNQLVNIWTHILALVYVIFEMTNDIFYIIPSLGGNKADKLVFAVFYLALVFCLLSSVAHHSFNSHYLQKFAVACFTVDWSSCCLVVCFCYALNTFCLFRKNPFWLLFYMTGFSALSLWYLYFNLTCSGLKHTKFRVKLSISVIFVCTLPLGHCLYLADAELSQIIKGVYANNLFWKVFSGGIYLVHFPERIWPVRFDLCGHSHNLWHVLCVCGILQWKYSALEFLEYIYKCSEVI